MMHCIFHFKLLANNKNMDILQIVFKFLIPFSIFFITIVNCDRSRDDNKLSKNLFRDFYLKSKEKVSHLNLNVYGNVSLTKQRLKMRVCKTYLSHYFGLFKNKSEENNFGQKKNQSTVTNDVIRKINKFGENISFGTKNKTRILHNDLSVLHRVGVRDYLHNSMRFRREAISCLETGSCEYNMNKDIPVCYCDIACYLFNDCCHNNIVDVETVDFEQIASYLKFNYTSCIIRVIPHHISLFRGYYMVTMCPDNYTDLDDKIKCAKDRSGNELPVVGKDGLTYKNEHCARCHGIIKFRRWSLQYHLDCDVTVDEISKKESYQQMIEVLQNAKCHPTVFPPNGVPRPRVCWKLEYFPIMPEIMLNKMECLRYQNPVIIQQPPVITARNIFCLDGESISKYSDICVLPVNETSLKYSFHSLSVMFEFNVVPEPKEDIWCQEKIKEDKCKIDNIVQNYQFEINLKLISNASLTRLFLQRVQGIIYSVLKAIMPWEIRDIFHCVYSYKYANFSDKLHNGFQNFTCLNCFDINATVFIELKERISFREISNFKNNIGRIEWTYIERYQTGLSTMGSSVTFITSEFVTTTNYNYMNMYIRFSSKEDFAFLELLNQQIALFTELETMEIPHFLVLVGLMKFNSIDPTNVETNKNHFQIVHIYVNKTVSQSSVRSITRQNQIISKGITYIEIFVTCIFMGLSSIFLLVTVVIQKHLKLTKTRAGKLSQNLMTCMILSHLLFIFGFGANDYKYICLIIGVFSHYAWLCCFTWMVIYSTMIIQIVKKQPSQTINTKTLPIFIYMIGYGTPLFFVVVSVVLDLTTQIKIGYSDDVCFPSVYPTNMAVFIAPVSILIIINVIVLAIAGYHLKTHKRDIESLTTSIQTRLYLPVYIRLALFSGLSWLLGIVAEATGIYFIRIVFLCLAGLHGVFFSISYLLSKQVQVEFKKRGGITRTAKNLSTKI